MSEPLLDQKQADVPDSNVSTRAEDKVHDVNVSTRVEIKEALNNVTTSRLKRVVTSPKNNYANFHFTAAIPPLNSTAPSVTPGESTQVTPTQKPEQNVSILLVTEAVPTSPVSAGPSVQDSLSSLMLNTDQVRGESFEILFT